MSSAEIALSDPATLSTRERDPKVPLCGGGGGNRTPVPRGVGVGISERSQQRAFGTRGLCWQAPSCPIRRYLSPPVPESRRGRPTLRCPDPARWAPTGRTGALSTLPVR